MSKRFCNAMDLERGISFLLLMDILGLLLYSSNILGIILGFEGGSVSYYYATVVAKVPVIVDLNTMVLLASSLILSLVSIPRIMVYVFLRLGKGLPENLYRRTAYLWVRALSSFVLISLQIALFVALLVFLIQDINLMNTDGNTSSPESILLYNKLIPMTVIYGVSLMISIILDIYWTLATVPFYREGIERSKKLLRPSPLST